MNCNMLPPQLSIFASGVSLSCAFFLTGEAPGSGTLETEQRWQAEDVLNSATSGSPLHPGKSSLQLLVAAQLPTQDCAQSCCVNRGTCVPRPSSLGPVHHFHLRTPPRITSKPTCPQGTPGAPTVDGRRGCDVWGGWARIILGCSLEDFLEKVEIKKP